MSINFHCVNVAKQLNWEFIPFRLLNFHCVNIAEQLNWEFIPFRLNEVLAMPTQLFTAWMLAKKMMAQFHYGYLNLSILYELTRLKFHQLDTLLLVSLMLHLKWKCLIVRRSNYHKNKMTIYGSSSLNQMDLVFIWYCWNIWIRG